MRGNNKSRSRKHTKRHTINFSRVLLIACVFIFLIIFGSNIVKASDKVEETRTKYYTSIRIEEGDTLWGIAEKYTENTNISIHDYINEVVRMNHLTSSTITSGCYLMIFYYE